MVSVLQCKVEKFSEGCVIIMSAILLFFIGVNMLTMISWTPKTFGMYIQAEPDSSKLIMAISMAKWAYWLSFVGLLFMSLRFGLFVWITKLQWKLIKPPNPPIDLATIHRIKNEISWWKKPMADITYVCDVLLGVSVVLSSAVMLLF